MKVLITGAGGQVASALLRCVPAGYAVRALARADLDITSAAMVMLALTDDSPDLIINTAAFTQVDAAENDPERAAAANARGPQNLADAAAAGGVRLLQLSTDFVFDGARGQPYRPGDAPRPLNVYGRTKLAGEQAVLATLPRGGVVLRTAWVYAAQGHNFVRTMLRLMQENAEVRVVADQVGTPTSAASIARAIWALAARPDLSGVYHWTDLGVASWYDFAVAVMEEARAAGLLPREVSVIAIPSAQFPRPAQRPAFSVLDKTDTVAALGLHPRHWRMELRTVLAEIARE